MSPPQPLARDPRPFRQRIEFSPGDVRMHFVAGRRCRKAAVIAGDDVLATNGAREALDPLRHEFGMFDLVDAMRHHAWDENAIRRQLHFLPDLPLVLMTRIGGLDGKSLRVDLEHEIDVVPEFEIVDAWCDVDTVAGVEADAVGRDAAQCMIDRLHAY